MTARTTTSCATGPTGELLKQLSRADETLVQQEIELAKAEMRRRASRPGIGAGCSAAPACSALGAFAAR